MLKAFKRAGPESGEPASALIPLAIKIAIILRCDHAFPGTQTPASTFNHS